MLCRCQATRTLLFFDRYQNMNLIFKNTCIRDSFTYLYVSGHRCDNTIECNDEFVQLFLQKSVPDNSTYKNKLLFYLDMAGFFTAQLERYIIIDYTPVSEFQKSFSNLHFIRWRYRMLADDQFGMGSGHGFVSVEEYGKHRKHAAALIHVQQLHVLSELPEDLFSDPSTNVTIFGLTKNRSETLIKVLQNDKKPVVENIIYKPEIFIHLMCAKEYGNFNAVLIKAKHDLADEIAAFQNVLDADN